MGKETGLQRKEMYQFYDKLKSIGYPPSRISMCMETVNMWRSMSIKYAPLTCNCYGKM